MRGVIGIFNLPALRRQPNRPATGKTVFERSLQPPALIIKWVFTDAGVRLDIAADIERQIVGKRLRIIEIGTLQSVIISRNARDSFGFLEVWLARNEIDGGARAIDGQHARRTALDGFEPLDRQVLIEKEVCAAAAVEDRQSVFFKLHEPLATALQSTHRIVVRNCAGRSLDKDAGYEFKQFGCRFRRLARNVRLARKRDVGRRRDQRTIARRLPRNDDLLTIGFIGGRCGWCVGRFLRHDRP